MKLARVEHFRCGDYAGYTYVMAPDDTTEERFQQDVNTAVTQYLAALDQFNQQNPPVDFLDIRTHEFPAGTTVEQARAMVKTRDQENHDWHVRRATLTHEFGHYLKPLGYVLVGEAEHIEAEADWGHRHGQEINYSKESLDHFMGLAPVTRLTRKALT